jgi:predicted double-glycine peptidase
MRGQQFSEDVRWSVIRAQHHGLGPRNIAALTVVSERQVRRIQDCHNRTGEVRTERSYSVGSACTAACLRNEFLRLWAYFFFFFFL